MAITKFEKDISYISKLADQPNDVSGGKLSAADLKAKFDQAGEDIKEYINNVLIPEVTSDIQAAAEGIGGDGKISADKLEDGTITSQKLAGASVETAKIADKAVTADKIADSAVGIAQLANDSVTADKLADGAVDRNAIKDEAVSTAKLFAGAVTTEKIKDASVTADKLAANAVSQTYTATILSTDWLAHPNGLDAYYFNLSVSGILSTDKVGFVDADTSSLATTEAGVAAALEIDEAWANIFRVRIMSNGVVRFYAKDKPEIDLPISITVIRK